VGENGSRKRPIEERGLAVQGGAYEKSARGRPDREMAVKRGAKYRKRPLRRKKNFYGLTRSVFDLDLPSAREPGGEARGMEGKG